MVGAFSFLNVDPYGIPKGFTFKKRKVIEAPFLFCNERTQGLSHCEKRKVIKGKPYAGRILRCRPFLGGVLVQRIPRMQAEGAVLLKKNLIYNNKKLY